MALFELAYELRVPVQVVRDMPYDDFQKWHLFFGKQPPGWKEDLRAYKIMQSMGVKEKPETQFSSLATLKAAENKQREAMAGKALANNLMRSAFFSKMLSASGGDTPAWMKKE